MKCLIPAILVCAFLAGDLGIGEETSQPVPVNLIGLLANPEKYDGKLVTVKAFLLVLGRSHDVAAYFLCLNREDAENELGNSVLLVPSREMQPNLEKFDRKYVLVTAVLNRVPTANGGFTEVMKDVKEYTVWSDPSRPILLKGDGFTKAK